MHVDELVTRCLMRDRIADAERRATLAAIRRQASGGSSTGSGIAQWLIELGRSLGKRCGSKVSKSPRRATALRASRSTR